MKRTSIVIVLLSTIIHCSYQTNKAKSTGTLLDSISIAARNGTYPNIDGVIISQNGKVVYEDYFNGLKKDDKHDTRSSFKSYTGLLTGIAIDKGVIKSEKEKAYPFFKSYGSFANPDPRKDNMTVEDLLAMKSGYDCEEFYSTKDCEDVMEGSKDWVKFSLDLPMAASPGTVWKYTSCNMMVLGGVIAQASGKTVQQFAAENLFDPLGITDYKWTVDAAGHGTTAGSFYIRPVDMLKIGELVLNKGKWQGKQVVSEGWIDKMTAPITKIDSFSFMKGSKTKLAVGQPAYYGYTWYRERIVTDKFSEVVIFASGNGGQYIMVIERLGLVVVFTGNSYNNWRSKLPWEVMVRWVLPYFKNK